MTTKPWLAPDIAQSISSGNPAPWLAPDLARAIRTKAPPSWIAPDIANDIVEAGISSGTFPPADALVALDFVNGQYYAGGTVALAGVIDQTAYVHDGALNLRSTDVAAQIIGAAATPLLDLRTGWTVVVDLEGVDISRDMGGAAIAVGDASDNDFLDINGRTTGTGTNWTFERDGGPDVLFAVTPAVNVATTRVKIAATYTDAKISISVNGSDVSSESTAIPVTPQTSVVYLGNYINNSNSDQNLKFYSVVVYAPKDDADLAALSAP